MPSLSNIVLILLLLLSLSSNTFSQNAGIEQCSSNLLPLAPCAPFVQGAAPLPAQSCCDNLKQLYIQQPSCLCLFLNETTLSSFPINTTLALQLPLICNLQISISTCTGTSIRIPFSWCVCYRLDWTILNKTTDVNEVNLMFYYRKLGR